MEGLGIITPISVATNKAGAQIAAPSVGSLEGVGAIAITPNGKTAYLAGGSTGAVTPVNVATNKPARAIQLATPADAEAIAITPYGKTAYVAEGGTGMITPINLTTGTAGQPINLRSHESGAAIAITPNGKIALVAGSTSNGSSDSGTVTRVDLAQANHEFEVWSPFLRVRSAPPQTLKGRSPSIVDGQSVYRLRRAISTSRSGEM